MPHRLPARSRQYPVQRSATQERDHLGADKGNYHEPPSTHGKNGIRSQVKIFTPSRKERKEDKS
jgi:hypothetical protein